MKRSTRILLEVVFFIVIYIGFQGDSFKLPFIEKLVLFCLFVILYAHGLISRFYILPKLKEKKIKTAVILSIINLVVFTFIFYEFSYFYESKFHPQDLKYVSYYNTFATCLLSLFVMASLELVIQYFYREKEKAEYKAIISQLENNNLKSQLNPHFLFNSLNNAYGISLSNPEATPNYILQLSQLIRYQLDSTKLEYVLLKDEIEFLENYLAIEKVRIGKRCTIVLENNLDNTIFTNYKVIPMVLNTFAENAVKHGANGINLSFIKITVANHNNELFFTCINSLSLIKNTGTQLGLKNVIQRLEIMYPNNYDLNISNNINDSTYTVDLKIKLTQYV